MTTVSPETVTEAARTINALQVAGITVDGVEFTEDDVFSVVTEAGDSVGPAGIGGGTEKGGNQ